MSQRGKSADGMAAKKVTIINNDWIPTAAVRAVSKILEIGKPVTETAVS